MLTYSCDFSREEDSLTALCTDVFTTSSITGVLCNHLGELGHGVAVLLSSVLQPSSSEYSGVIWLWKRKQPLQKVLEFRKLIFLGAALWGVHGAEGEAGPTAYVLGLASAP